MNTFTDKGTAPFDVIGESEPSTVEDYERQIELDRYKHIRWLQDAKVGSTDWGGQQITAILNKSDMFLIYRVEGDRDDDALKLFVAGKSDDQEKLMADNYDRMQIELLGVYSVMRKSKNPRPLLRKVASVIAMVIEANPADAQNKYEDAKLICREIVDQVNKEYNKLIDGKLIYLSGCLFTVALLTSLSVTSVYLKQTEFIIKITTLLPFLYAATFASYGGFISVSTAINQLVFETDLRKIDYMLYGFTRILVSILGGIFIFMVVKSGLLNFIPSSSLFSVLVFCFAAGFSEKLVPDVLRRIEAGENEKTK